MKQLYVSRARDSRQVKQPVPTAVNEGNHMKEMRAILIGVVFAAAQVAPAPVSAAMSILEMDEAAGKLVLEFEKDGRRIFYDMQLGHEMELPPTAEDLASNPELPTYSVNAQVSDVNGDVFHSR